MSINQSRADKSEAQLKKPGRSSSSSYQRSFSSGSTGKGGGGGTGTAPQPSVSSNKSYKKSSNGQGAQFRVIPGSTNSEVTATSRALQNGAHVQIPSHGGSGAPVSSIAKPNESSVTRISRGLPKAPSSQSSSGASDNIAPTIPSKGDMPRSFPLQFGTISPGVMNGMQIPARTSSAPPNLDEQKRDQVCHDSYRSVPMLPIPSSPKQQQLGKDAVYINQSNTAESHPPTQAKRDVHAQMPVPAAVATQKSSVPPITTMPLPFQPSQVPVQYGGPSPQIQTQGVAASSLQMSMPLAVGNAPQVQQQVFVQSLQSHPLQSQGMMHQSQSLNFAPQMGHQLAPQLGNLGLGIAPQFSQQQAGKFSGPRKTTVKITHPDTHEELRLDKRTDSYSDAGPLGPRSHPIIPPQSQPIPSFSPAHPINFYQHIQPNTYNPSPIFYPTTSHPLTSTQMTPGSPSLRYSYPVGQGAPTVSYMNPSVLNPLSIGKSGPPMHGIPEQVNSEHANDGHALAVSAPSVSVQVTVKPAVGPLAEKVGTSSVTVSSPVSKGESPKLLRPPEEDISSHQQRESELTSESNFQQPKSFSESLSKHSTTASASVSIQRPLPDTSSIPIIPTEESASVATNTDGRRRETIRRPDSLKDQQKKLSKKEVRQSQQQPQADVSDSAGSLKMCSIKGSKDGSLADLNAKQVSQNPENFQAPSKVVGTATAPLNLPSPNLEHCISSVVRISETEEGKKTVFVSSETSGITLEAAARASRDVHKSAFDASDAATNASRVGERGLCETSNPSGLEGLETIPENLDSAHHTQHNDQTLREAVLKQEIEGYAEHRKIKSPDGSQAHTGPTVSESCEVGTQIEPVSQKEAAVDNVVETIVGSKSRYAENEQVGTNVEALTYSSEGDSLVRPATTSSDTVNAETVPSSYVSLSGASEEKLSSADASTNKIERHSQEVAVTESGVIFQGTARPPPVSSEMTRKIEGKGPESTSGGPVSVSVSGSKDRLPLEQNKAKSTTGKKKKRKEIFLKADAAGTTSDLYVAYKGPEEKNETPTPESIDSSSSIDVMQKTDADGTEKDVTAHEEDGQTKAELDDWEDVAEIASPKLKTSENGEQIQSTMKHHDEYGSGYTGKKKYSRDFLLTLSEHCTALPAGFQIGSDIAEALLPAQVAISHLVDHESYPNSGRIVDRSAGGSRIDRRVSGMVDDDKWNKAFGPFSSGRDPRLDVGHGGSVVGFRPGQGGNHGVLRNLRVSGILSGPMPALASPGGMPRNISDADRWQRATGIQKGLIPSPQTPLQVMHKADKKYEVGKASDKEETKQRQLKAILNKLTPQNFDKLFEQVKEVNIDSAVTLTGVISQIFDKALTEPTFCEMYANFCLHLSGELPDFNEDNEKITFKRLLLNKCQEEFERGEREQAEADRVEEEGEIKRSEEEREGKKVQARRRMLGNIRLIGELYKKKMLTERIMHECIKKLLGQYQNSDEEDVEALCKLMSTIGEMIDHPKAKDHMDAYFDRMQKLSINQKLSSRVRFMLRDAIDLRKNRWQQRRKVEGPKKIEEVHRDAAQERLGQAQPGRLSRSSGGSSLARRGQPVDYGTRGSTLLYSPSNQQIGGPHGLPPPQLRGYGGQDVRMEERNPFESRMLSVPLPQRPIDDDSITLGPQGGLARGMSIRGQSLMSSVPMTDIPPSAVDSRRMASGPNGYSSVSDWTPYNSREELMARYASLPVYDQANSQERNTSFVSRDLRNADHSFNRSTATTPSGGRMQGGSSTGTQNVSSEAKVWPEEHLRKMSIAAIQEFYRLGREEELILCVKDLNSPGFYPDMISQWVIDSFERKDIDRDLLAKLLINLGKSREIPLSQLQLIKGFESVLSSLEDAITDAPKAAEHLGRILGKIILENLVSLREIGRLVHEGGEEPGRLLQIGLASEVLGSILEIIRIEKGESILNEMRTSSNLRLEDFRPPDPSK